MLKFGLRRKKETHHTRCIILQLVSAICDSSGGDYDVRHLVVCDVV